jgi:hypothetical protein
VVAGSHPLAWSPIVAMLAYGLLHGVVRGRLGLVSRRAS